MLNKDFQIETPEMRPEKATRMPEEIMENELPFSGKDELADNHQYKSLLLEEAELKKNLSIISIWITRKRYSIRRRMQSVEDLRKEISEFKKEEEQADNRMQQLQQEKIELQKKLLGEKGNDQKKDN